MKKISKAECEKLVTTFWYTYYTKAKREERTSLVNQFLSETFEIDAEITPPAVFDKYVMRHPMTRKKSNDREYRLLDIMADFIIAAKHEGAESEKKKEYPVHNQDKALRDQRIRLKKEVTILLDNEQYDDDKPVGRNFISEKKLLKII